MVGFSLLAGPIAWKWLINHRGGWPRRDARQDRWTVQLASRVLGIHHNFCRRKGNATVQKRVKSMKDIWVRLKLSTSPLQHKVTALLMMAWPRALHGISLVHLGSSHFQSLRSGALKGLKTNRKGANPMVQLCSFGLHVDPEMWAVLATIKDARAFASDQVFRADLRAYAGTREVQNGPVGVLVARLERLGWQLQDDGLVCDHLGSFDVLQCAWEEVLIRAKWAWMDVVGTEVLHRSSFDGLHRGDMTLVHKMLREMDSADQAILRAQMDGTLYTVLGRAHFEDNTTDQCPFCSERDGFFHRNWECKFFEEDREFLSPGTRDQIGALPRCWSCHGWPVIPEAVQTLQQALLDVPPPQLCNELPIPMHGRVHLFTDGSCVNSDDVVLRLGSWAVTQALGDIGGLEHQVIAAGHLQGLLQTAYRGELVAVYQALCAVCKAGVVATLWCDNAAVVRGVRRLLGRPRQLKLPRNHSDLWVSIQDTIARLHPKQVQICKVISHGSPSQATNDLERWAFYHNGLVDHAAVHINSIRSPRFNEVWSRAASQVRAQRKLAKDVWQVQLAVAKRAMASVPVNTPRVHPSTEALEDAVAAVAVPDPVAQLRSSWSPGFFSQVSRGLSDVLRWWNGVGMGHVGGDYPLVWISGIQLLVDFALTVGHLGPQLVNRKWSDVDCHGHIPMPDLLRCSHTYPSVLDEAEAMARRPCEPIYSMEYVQLEVQRFINSHLRCDVQPKHFEVG
eukprot:Skav233036  [mRNA]  locus=scaffold909:1064996:1071975:+ [translate_table: standard]